jgi:hypothetical protein
VAGWPEWRFETLYPIPPSLIRMQVTHQLLVLAHLIGFAALLGGVLAQTRQTEREVTGPMLWGGWAELVTGVALVVLALVAGGSVAWVPVSVKLVTTLFLVLVLARNRRFLSIPRGLWALIGVLTLVDAGLSVLWQ